jgi:hypothetical protein
MIQSLFTRKSKTFLHKLLRNAWNKFGQLRYQQT